MMPWGHLAIGYLVYTVVTRVRGHRAPDGAPTLVLAVATQLPDLVDKPLNWWFDVFDGRGIGHSLLTVTAVCVLVAFVAHRYDRRELAGAFSLGLYSHLLADTWRSLLAGEFGQAAFLLWPLFPTPTYPKDSLFDHVDAWLAHLQTLQSSPATLLTGGFGIQLVLVVVLFGIWALDGFPGVKTLWRLVSRRRQRTVRAPER
ncbi:metal-dependent hydrolase [Haloplanus litoreus]|uniref:Metal-dependent hydrolase n=1 Tax=Haloplanus litoreus TaxID=767515 RepID=A0ABD5ZV98_9EURY